MSPAALRRQPNAPLERPPLRTALSSQRQPSEQPAARNRDERATHADVCASRGARPEVHEHTVFVVDDDVSVREALNSLIETAGWKVISFASAEAFLDHPRASGPNCLVLDVGLPDLSGLDLQLRMAVERSDMPIIFVTGNGDVPMSVRAMKAGAAEFLTKPFGEEELLGAVESALRRSRRMAEEQTRLEEIPGRLAKSPTANADGPVPLHGLDEGRLKRVLDYMGDHLGDNVDVDELAGVACLSPFHFTRMFRNRIGVPPYRYMVELRLGHAKTLLANSDESLVEIALATCFSSQSNFTRAFRRATGMTPGEYRRKRS
jgi:FixJ family two-component response regulator